MANRKAFVGIDPDFSKSGISILYDDKSMDLLTLGFADAITYLIQLRESGVEIKTIFIEAGWENKKASWYVAESKAIAARIGNKIGLNACTGIKLGEMLEFNGFTIVFVRPTKSKVNHEQFVRFTQYKGRATNQEKRDAGMLVVGMFG